VLGRSTIKKILPNYVGRHFQWSLPTKDTENGKDEILFHTHFLTPPPNVLKFLCFAESGECGPLSRAEVYGNCYSGRRRPVLVTLRAKCRLAVDVPMTGHTPAHIYDFSPHVDAGI
jgi:hypothetical protein